MTTEITDKTELLGNIKETSSELLALMSALREAKVNVVPYEGSWTASQLLQHVTKSTNWMTQALKTDGKRLERDPAGNIGELKKIFLDFLHKLDSPEEIVPGKGPFEKTIVMKEFSDAFDALVVAAKKADLNEFNDNTALGEKSKLELLHFVWYHTQRHLHQMRKIVDALEGMQ